MSIRHRGSRATISVVMVSALLLLVQPIPSFGQLDTNPRNNCEAIVDADVQATATRTTPSLTNFPVVVHYMKHKSEGSGPGSAVSGIFPLSKLKAFFAELGFGTPADMILDVLPRLLARGAPVAVYNTPEYLRDVGSPARHALAERDIAAGRLDSDSLL